MANSLTDSEAITWRKVTCQERDTAFTAGNASWSVGSSLTDLNSQHGDPIIFTEWRDRVTETPVLRDRRYPSREHGDADLRPCEHYLAEVVR